MDRKDFLLTSLPLLSGPEVFLYVKRQQTPAAWKIPPYLKKGSAIGITCPSGFISDEDIQPCLQKLEDWGFSVIRGKTIGLRDGTFGGTDEERARDLQQMLDTDDIDAIMLGRGGYGAIRIIDKVNFNAFVKKPKWIIGFSDATVIHSHLNNALHIASVHSKMCNSFPREGEQLQKGQLESIESIKDALQGKKIEYSAATELKNRTGKCTGRLKGGNLSVIQMLCGSQSAMNSNDCILFLEDVGEYLYRIDGMMWSLKRNGTLENLKGLIIGNFRIKPDDPGEEFGLQLKDIIMEKVKEYTYPVCFNFPVGHVFENYALRTGALHQLEVTPHFATLASLE